MTFDFDREDPFDYAERRIKEEVERLRITDIQQLPLAQLRRWQEADPYDAGVLLSTRSVGTDALAVVPHCVAYRSTNQAINNTTVTAVQLDNERWDDGASAAHHDTVTNNTRLTCQVAGLYQITAWWEWESNAVGTRNAALRLGGTTNIAEVADAANGSDETRQHVAALWRLAAGEYVELTVYQSSGAARNIEKADLGFAWLSN